MSTSSRVRRPVGRGRTRASATRRWAGPAALDLATEVGDGTVGLGPIGDRDPAPWRKVEPGTLDHRRGSAFEARDGEGDHVVGRTAVDGDTIAVVAGHVGVEQEEPTSP